MLYDPKWASPEVKLEPWQKVCLKAAELLEQHGWTQGAAKNIQTGAMCAAGAMYYANKDLAHPLDYYADARYHFLKAVKAQNIPAWNDMPERTKEEVISTLRNLAQ